jgi:hypothetical protein
MRMWASAALIASAALPSTAGITVDQYAAPYVYYTSYVDFGASSTVPGHWNYNLFNTSEHYHGYASKYFDIAVTADAQYAPTGRCYEIATSAVPGGVTTDTEILVKLPNNTVWQRLSDDYGGTVYSRARFWFGEDYVDPANIFVRVSVYSAPFNNGEFNFSASQIRTGSNQPVATEADCFADAGVAAAFVDRHENVFIRRAI